MFDHQCPSGDPARPSAVLAAVAAVDRFRLTETEIGSGCREIEVKGELDFAVSDRLRQAIAGCRADQILINLAGCQFIDSAGIAVLLRAHRSESPRVAVHSPSGQVLRILEVTGLTDNGLVFADRGQALDALVELVRS